MVDHAYACGANLAARHTDTAQEGAFLQKMHLSNGSVHFDLPTGVSMDVWVDATTDVVRVTSSGMKHKLEARLEVLWE